MTSHAVAFGDRAIPPRDTIAGFLAALDHQEWAADALCAQTDPEAFFPNKSGSTREAKAVCGRCEARPDCLEYALDNQERWGIWGGASERERRKIEKSRRRSS